MRVWGPGSGRGGFRARQKGWVVSEAGMLEERHRRGDPAYRKKKETSRLGNLLYHPSLDLGKSPQK